MNHHSIMSHEQRAQAAGISADNHWEQGMRESLLGYHYTELTFPRLLADKAAKNGDKIFLEYLPDGREFSYAAIDTITNAVANSLLSAGLIKGDHAAMLMGNSPEQIQAYFSLAKIGVVAVPLNTSVRGHFLEYYLNNSDATVLFVDGEYLAQFVQIADRTNIKKVYVVGDFEPPVDSKGFVCRPFAELLDGSVEAPGVDVRYDDTCALMYTSGTTGPSKGNIFPQIHTITFGADQIALTEVCSDDIYYTWMPLFHIGAYGGIVMNCLLMDARIALVRTLSVSNFWEEMRRSRATATMLLSIGDFLFKQPPSPQDRDHCLRFAVTTPVPPDVVELEERFGFKMMQGFGLSDYAMAFSQSLHEPPEKRLSLGRPLTDVTARIVDEDGLDVPIGESGEIVLRKDGLPFACAQGYYKMPEATLACRSNLWFHTGDVGSRDADGYFYFGGRKKDAIRRRGENISAYEVEVALCRHESVAEAAVYAFKVERSDDEVVATIVLKAGHRLEAGELIAHCFENMPRYMVPRFIDFRSELPRTTTQKVMKFVLREEVQTNRERYWDRDCAAVPAA